MSKSHKAFVEKCIEEWCKRRRQAAAGREGCKVKGYENGFYLGPTVFDHVTPEMKVGREEIFGPVLCIKG